MEKKQRVYQLIGVIYRFNKEINCGEQLHIIFEETMKTILAHGNNNMILVMMTAMEDLKVKMTVSTCIIYFSSLKNSEQAPISE